METKRCYMCTEHKPLDQFYRDRNSKDGHQRRCKDCHRLWVKGYVYDYEQKRRQRDPEYNEKWLAHKRKKSAEWREKNPDDTKARARKEAQRRSSDPELRAKYTAYERKRRQERQQTDPEYHQRLMNMAKEGQSRRRARLNNGGGSHTNAEWRKLCAAYNHCCVCCGEHRPLTEDHILAIINGGSDNIENIQPLCDTCNKRKGTKTIDYRY